MTSLRSVSSRQRIYYSGRSYCCYCYLLLLPAAAATATAASTAATATPLGSSRHYRQTTDDVLRTTILG